jgi:hypothetical protein
MNISKKQLIQIIAAAFLITAIVLLIPFTNWLDNTSIYGFISLVIGTLGSIISIFIPTSFVYEFKEEDWDKKGERDYLLTIASKKHGLGSSSQVQTFMKQGEKLSMVGVSTTIDINGNIYVNSSQRFAGKIIAGN